MSGSLKGYRDGLLAETIAAFFLICKGYRILNRRYKTTAGEIDLIVRRRNVTVFVEVKKRGTLDDGLYAVSDHQIRRIIRAAGHYAMSHRHVGDMRFDVVAVKLPFSVRHIESAFTS